MTRIAKLDSKIKAIFNRRGRCDSECRNILAQIELDSTVLDTSD